MWKLLLFACFPVLLLCDSLPAKLSLPKQNLHAICLSLILDHHVYRTSQMRRYKPKRGSNWERLCQHAQHDTLAQDTLPRLQRT